ncbi:hypothetical protein F2Q70_00007514 [Brassica cretica]|uniref:4-hydroxy-4-methyl-2-oxoglutarate aldolase n=1 Tax=Brassica cretica TaxID=69181 RepID=A0A8S9M6I7_BRACR|nr:hypothetical protein F2Q70_00007514 [Brassica cretica]
MAFVTTAEVCDANQDLIRSGELRALRPIFQIYGRRQIFSGPVVTVKVFEDNGLIRQFLEEKGINNIIILHPLYRESELIEENVLGVRNAAQRKLLDELGIVAEDVPLNEFTPLGRMLYKAPSDGKWGEHELDYLLFIVRDVKLQPNPDEVADIKYVSREELKELVKKADAGDDDEAVKLSPWFRLVVDNFLMKCFTTTFDLIYTKTPSLVSDTVLFLKLPTFLSEIVNIVKSSVSASEFGLIQLRVLYSYDQLLRFVLIDSLSKSQPLEKRKKMAFVTTAEVCDANQDLIRSGELRALQPVFQIYGRRQIFSGPVVTVKVFEDNGLIRQFLEEKGNGRVLVVDGGGSQRCAILGGNPVVQAQNNGWAGIIVNGCIRDVDEINGCDIGVRALASHPIKASKKGLGEQRVPVNIAGTRICDGEWVYADTDGVLVSQTELSV